jgi:hypothetical protein
MIAETDPKHRAVQIQFHADGNSEQCARRSRPTTVPAARPGEGADRVGGGGVKESGWRSQDLGGQTKHGQSPSDWPSLISSWAQAKDRLGHR